MARFKRPLKEQAVRLANQDLGNKYPQLVQNGTLITLDPNNPEHEQYIRDWADFYLANGGELESTGTPLSAGTTRVPTPNPYVKFLDGKKHGSPIRSSLEAHVFFSASNCIYVAERWPLREYYLYLDIDPTDKVDFDTMGLLWTDENGFPHYTDGNGNPTERVPAFVLAWSKKSSTEIQKKGASVAFVFDRDRQKLEEKKKKVEQAAGGGPLPEKYRINLIDHIREVSYDRGFTTCLFVPDDKETLDVGKLKDLMKKCDAEVDETRKAHKALVDFITKSITNQTLYFHRGTIDAWLDEKPGRRAHLIKMNQEKTLYQASCDNFDRDLKELEAAYDAQLDKLQAILKDETNLENIGKIDYIVEDVYEPSGEHLLWRHQFMCEALGFFSGTPREHEIFEKFVAPLVHNLSVPFGDFRNKCTCSTCGYFENDVTTLKETRQLKGEKFWKSKDLKLGTRTGLRVIDLFTKFKDNIGFVIARNKLGLIGGSADFKYTIGLSLELFVRCNMFRWTSGGKYAAAASRWIEILYDIRNVMHGREDKFEEIVKEMKKFMESQGTFKAKVVPKIADSFTLIGAACVFWYIFTKEGSLTRKDAADFLNSVTDVAKASLSLGRGTIERRLIAKYGEEVGGKLAKNLPKWGARIGFAGGVFQVASSYISLSDAADKGNRREFGWAAVSYTGASISLSGLALDLFPEPVVTKGTGIVLNFVGGVVYLVGQAGEFITRPEDVELFLRNEYWWRDDAYEDQSSKYQPDNRPFRMDPGKI